MNTSFVGSIGKVPNILSIRNLLLDSSMDPVTKFFNIAIQTSLLPECGGHVGRNGYEGQIFDRIAYLNNPTRKLGCYRVGASLKERIRSAYAKSGLAGMKDTLCSELSASRYVSLEAWAEEDKWKKDQFQQFCNFMRNLDY